MRPYSTLREILTCIRPLEPQDWERVHLYARRIKNLKCTYQDPELAPSTWAEIAISLPPSAPFLLPELQELSCPDNEVFFAYIRLLLPPCLDTLRLNLSHSDSGASRIATLIALPRLCPNITTIEIGQYFDISVGAKMESILPRFASLRQLVVHLIQAEHIEGLLRSLPRTTVIELQMDPEAKQVLSQSRDRFLPDVTWVTLLDCSLLLAANLISRIDSPFVHTIVIWPILSSKAEYTRFMQSLKGHTSLNSIHIKEEKTYVISGAPEYCLDSQVFHSLIALPNLTTVIVTSNAAIRIDDELLSTLSSRCRSLRRLHLLTRQTHHSSPVLATLNGVYSVIQNCPELANLGLVIDANKPFTPVHGEVIRLNKAVKKLYVGHSPITDSVTVAIALAIMLPNLSRITTTAPNEGCCASEWKEVARHLEVTNALRTRLRS